MNSPGETALRIGVVGSIPHPTAGGASTLMESLIQVLKTTESYHVFIRLTEPGYVDEVGKVNPEVAAYGQLRRLRTKVRATRFGDSLQGRSAGSAAVRRLKFAGPLKWTRGSERSRSTSYGSWRPLGPEYRYHTSLRYGISHIAVQPYFPEVSISGWDWEAREQTYRSVLPRASFVLTGTHAGKSEIVHYYGVNPDNVIVVPFPVPAVAGEIAFGRFWTFDKNMEYAAIS